jgi:hypothetical protein
VFSGRACSKSLWQAKYGKAGSWNGESDKRNTPGVSQYPESGIFLKKAQKISDVLLNRLALAVYKKITPALPKT